MFNTCGLGKRGNCLEFTKRPVDQIAYAVGWDTGAFRRLFRRIIGLSPGEGFRTPTSTSVAA